MHMSNGLVDYRGYVLTTPPHVEVNEQHENL